MNKQLLLGVGIGVVVAVAAGAVASYSDKHSSDAAMQPVITSPAVASVAPSAAAATSAAVPAPELPAETVRASQAAASAPTPAADPAPKSAWSKLFAPAAPKYALVVSSVAVTDSTKVPREECRDVQVTQQKPVKDEKRVAGAALGAIVGGILGNQVGDGDGRKLATAAGAIAGGVAGSKIQRRVQQGNTETVTERKCTTVYDIKEKTLGYDVRYKVAGEIKKIRMTTDPAVGSKLPLKNGQVIAAVASGA